MNISPLGQVLKEILLNYLFIYFYGMSGAIYRCVFSPSMDVCQCMRIVLGPFFIYFYFFLILFVNIKQSPKWPYILWPHKVDQCTIRKLRTNININTNTIHRYAKKKFQDSDSHKQVSLKRDECERLCKYSFRCCNICQYYKKNLLCYQS